MPGYSVLPLILHAGCESIQSDQDICCTKLGNYYLDSHPHHLFRACSWGLACNSSCRRPEVYVCFFKPVVNVLGLKRMFPLRCCRWFGSTGLGCRLQLLGKPLGLAEKCHGGFGLISHGSRSEHSKHRGFDPMKKIMASFYWYIQIFPNVKNLPLSHGKSGNHSSWPINLENILK